MSSIPVIDIASTRPNNATSKAEHTKIVGEIKDAFSGIGFCYLKNHGIPQEKIDKLFHLSEGFFTSPVEFKREYTRNRDTNHGWVALEQECLNPERPGDFKESFNYIDRTNQQWPSDVSEFHQAFEDLFLLGVELSYKILDLISLAFELGDVNYLRNLHFPIETTKSGLRSLYYPPISEPTVMKAGQVRCGEHSDYGTITVLFQGHGGGLQVQRRDGVYIEAPPIPGTVLINLGDLMQRWTADRFVAAKHRVMTQDDDVMKGQSRQSLALFVHPCDEAIIECLDGSGKYEPIGALEYLLMRFKATY